MNLGLLTGICLFLCPLQTDAQDDQYRDIIYLRKKRESIIGQLIKTETRDFLFREEGSDDTIRIQKDQVIKIRFLQGDLLYFTRGRYHFLTGSYLQLGFGAGIGNSSSTHFHGIFARRIAPHFSAGAGLSIDKIQDQARFENYDFLTPHLYLRKLVSREYRENKFYVTGRGGYAIVTDGTRFNGEYSGGVQWSVGMGVLCSSRKIFKFGFEYNYLAQELTLSSIFPSPDPDIGGEAERVIRKVIFKNILRMVVNFN